MLTSDRTLDLARRIAEPEAHSDYLSAAAVELQEALGADEVFWLSTDFTANRFAVWRGSEIARDPEVESVMPHLFHHPAIQSYIRDLSDLTPRRVSDLSSSDESCHRAALRLSQRFVGRCQWA